MSEADDIREFMGLVGKGKDLRLNSNELKRIVWYKQPAHIYNRIPNHIKATVLQGRTP